MTPRLTPILLFLLLGSAWGPAWAAPVAAVGEVPLVGASLAGVQEKAVRKAMEAAVDAAVRQAVAATQYQASYPAIAGTILARADAFVTNYSIEGREVSDALYTVRLQVSIDHPLLLRRLTAIGLLGGGAVEGGRKALVFEGVPEPVRRRALTRLEMTLGDEGGIVPRRFERNLAEYELLTGMPLGEMVQKALAGPAQGGSSAPELTAEITSFGVLVRFPLPAHALAAHGQTVPFYRKAPRPGEPNPDDIRGVERVPWREAEPDDAPEQAALLPLGQGVLGSIDPARDRDFFKVEIPGNTRALSVAVGNTGPGEFRPRARVFALSGARAGSLLWEGRAPSRGRSLRGSFPLPSGVGSVLVSVEDDLGRYGTAYPYRLVVAAGERPEEP